MDIIFCIGIGFCHLAYIVILYEFNLYEFNNLSNSYYIRDKLCMQLRVCLLKKLKKSSTDFDKKTIENNSTEAKRKLLHYYYILYNMLVCAYIIYIYLS